MRIARMEYTSITHVSADHARPNNLFAVQGWGSRIVQPCGPIPPRRAIQLTYIRSCARHVSGYNEMKQFVVSNKKGLFETLFASTLRAAKNWCKLNNCTLEKEILTFKIV